MKHTLKQFEEILPYSVSSDPSKVKQNKDLASECQSIADSMAIEFANWLGIYGYIISSGDKNVTRFSNDHKLNEIPITDLLLKFKKEVYGE